MGSRILALTPEAGPFRALAGNAEVESVVIRTDAGGGLESFATDDWSLVLLDGAFAAGGGGDLLERLVQSRPEVPVVLVTRHPSVEVALRAVERGARDVISYPPDPVRVLSVLPRPSDNGAGRRIRLREAGEEGELVGCSAAMLEVFRTVARVADSSATILLQGESGTGKELVARALHRSGPRRGEPFVAVNCAAIPDALLESELFGHEKGAFTGAISRRRGRFERAHGGTLLLDEVGDMSLPLQAKILRVLEEREVERVGAEGSLPVDVRVVAASNRPLDELVARERFREDLYYRLAVVPVSLPPLREREEDLLLLARHFGAHAARRHGRDVRALSGRVADRLAAHSWPGNVRELRNVMERAVLLAESELIREEHLPIELRKSAAEGSVHRAPPPPDASLETVEAAHIRTVVRAEAGNLSQASRVLGIHRNTLRRKLRKYDIPH